MTSLGSLTFDVQTEIGEFRSNCSGGLVVVPQLVVLSMLLPWNDLGAWIRASGLYVQHETAETTLDEVELKHIETSLIQIQ